MYVVQFSNLNDFLSDLFNGKVGGIYHDLIDQRVTTGNYGLTRWRLATIIRALVAIDRVTHIAAVTFTHPTSVDEVNGRIIGPGDDDALRRERWATAQTRHDAIIEHLQSELAQIGLWHHQRPGVLSIPPDLALVYAENPVRVTEEIPHGEQSNPPARAA